MAEGQLTQEEIDALLSGTAFDGGTAASTAPAAAPAAAGPALTEEELKVLGERLKTGMASAAQVTSTLIGQNLVLSPISIDAEDDSSLGSLMPGDAVVFNFAMRGPASGAAALSVSRNEAISFAASIMGLTEKPAELEELHKGAVREVMDKFADGLCRALGREAMLEVTPDPVAVGGTVAESVPLAGKGKRILAQFSVKIESGPEGNLDLVLEMPLARALAGSRKEAAPVPLPKAVGAPVAAPPATAARTVGIQQVQFPTLAPSLSENQTKNIEILLDVPMQVTVELGRTTMMIRDVLELGTGSIIELDKLAGEPVDLLVNQKLIARGEVVVIDENFGVRVTDIISPMERLKNLQ